MGLTFNKLNHQRLKKHRRWQRKYKARAYESRKYKISPTKSRRIWGEIEKMAKENGWL